ncbi:MAG: sulfatase [Phycisphaerae bacterium]
MDRFARVSSVSVSVVRRVFGCLAAGLCALGPADATASEAEKPNIVFLLADDLGWSDLGCYGADLHETPHLDRLAREGVRFTQAYAMSVCTPTRAAILTGKHPARLHMTVWRESSVNRDAEAARSKRRLLAPLTVSDLPHCETTMAEALRAAGYLTFHVGKWHLGDAEHSPETHGFDVNVGGTHWGAPASYFWPFRGESTAGGFRYVPGLGLGRPGEYLTDRLTEEAIKLMDAAGRRPFFLNLWFHNPHTPIEGKPDLVEQYRHKLGPGLHHQNPDYAAMVHTLDENVGRILEYLETRGIAHNTLVVFTSDNGGYVNQFKDRQVTDNAPLRSGKGSLYEGGLRVPLIVRLPGITAAGATCDAPVICMDFFPTLAELTGARGDTATDGVSLMPLLRNVHARPPHDALFFHYPHYYATTAPAGAVRQANWKLLEYYEDGRLELYDLHNDPSEQENMAARRPDQAARLRALLHSWRQEVGAQMPSPNPACMPPASTRTAAIPEGDDRPHGQAPSAAPGADAPAPTISKTIARRPGNGRADHSVCR